MPVSRFIQVPVTPEEYRRIAALARARELAECVRVTPAAEARRLLVQALLEEPVEVAHDLAAQGSGHGA